MNYDKFIEPKQISIGERKFTISKIPALKAQVIYTAVAKSVSENGALGMTMLPTATVRDILNYVAVYDESNDYHKVLDTEDSIGNTFNTNVGDMVTVVVRMIHENFGFLTDGNLLALLEAPEGADSVS